MMTLVVWLQCQATPDPDVVQRAAERAAGAIVTVERADTALARAERHVGLTFPTRARVEAQREQVEAMKRHDAPPEIIVAAQDSIIAGQDSIIAHQDSAIAVLTPALQATRDTLATYRVPIIPAPTRSSLLGKLGSVTKYVGPSIGYGAVFADGGIEAGPTALIGVHVTHGVVGISAGYGATYSGGALHTGVGANVGVRLTL